MVGKGVILSEIRLAERFEGYQAWGAPDCRKWKLKVKDCEQLNRISKDNE